MITVGVDLAAEPARTALVTVDWSAGTVTDAVVGVDDDTVLAASSDAAKIGLDCPLGWPDTFVDFVAQHRAGTVRARADTIEARRTLVYRATDLHCQQRGIRPLSVAADRIAHAALRCAGLLARLGEPDRSGAGRVVECYPAGSLHAWGLPHRRYKNDPAQLERSLEALATRTGLDFVPGVRAVCAGSDHAFDAVVVAITTRAAALGRAEQPPERFRARARHEGWISLPDPALEALRG